MRCRSRSPASWGGAGWRAVLPLLLLVTAACTVATGLGAPRVPAPSAEAGLGATAGSSPGPTTAPSPSASPSPTGSPGAAATTVPDWLPIPPASLRPPPRLRPPAADPTPPPGGVTAIGDSVMLDAAPNLQSLIPGIAIDAAVNRHVYQGIAEMQTLAASGSLGASVVIALGTNGSFTAGNLDEFVALAGGRHLVLLTNHCPSCWWVLANNAVIESGCTAARRCTVADWNALADANPGWFGPDGIHMPSGGAGGQAYAELVTQAL
jgi:hypothetical protein